jgi:hypothetical protein
MYSHIVGVIVCVFTSNAVGRGIEKEIKDNLQQLLIRNTSKFDKIGERKNILDPSACALAR